MYDGPVVPAANVEQHRGALHPSSPGSDPLHHMYAPSQLLSFVRSHPCSIHIQCERVSPCLFKVHSDFYLLNTAAFILQWTGKRGDSVLLVGHNGAGKTTLFLQVALFNSSVYVEWVGMHWLYHQTEPMDEWHHNVS